MSQNNQRTSTDSSQNYHRTRYKHTKLNHRTREQEYNSSLKARLNNLLRNLGQLGCERGGKDTHALFKVCVKYLERKKLGRMDFQSFRDTIDIFERWVSLASLNLSNIGKVHPCFLRQFLLSKILAFTHLSYLLPKLIGNNVDIHPPERYNDEDYQSRDDKSYFVVELGNYELA